MDLPRSISSLIRSMLAEFSPVFPKIWWVVPATITVVGAQLVEPYVYKLLVDSLAGTQSAEQSIVVIFPIVAWWGGSVVLSIFIELIRDYYSHKYLMLHWMNVISTGMRSFLRKEYGFHLDVNNSEKMKFFNRGMDASYYLTEKLILEVPKSLLLLIGYMGLVFWMNWRLTLTLLLIIPFLLVGPIYFGNRAHILQREVSKLWDRVYSFIGDSITNILVVKMFHRIDHIEKLNRDVVLSATRAQIRLGFVWSFLGAFSQGINLFLSLFVLAASLYFYSKGWIGLGDIILFLTIANKLAAPFLQLESLYREFVRYAADYFKYQQILDLPDEYDGGKLKFPKKYAEFRFENVSFTYENSTREVIKGIDLILKRGEKVALVGHTGSGKSTIANLIARFYQPNSGTITVDGVSIQEFSLREYRSKFAAVFQDTTLFNDTLRANLEFVRDGLTLNQIRQACHDANILDFVESLPEGFETVVGERGLKLSGGEKQRIAIARAMLADPEILILDEATSALDSKTEKLVSEGLEKLMKGRTSVIIAHRLSTIKRAERIYLLNDGKVLGSGSHTELYKSSSVYREMVDYQRNGFME